MKAFGAFGVGRVSENEMKTLLMREAEKLRKPGGALPPFISPETESALRIGLCSELLYFGGLVTED